MAIRDTAGMLLPAVKLSIAALENRTEADAALIRLAEQYATTIDETESGKAKHYVLKNLGPLLHDALESLGATPVARTKSRASQGSAPGGTGRLAALRAAHSAS